MHYLKQSHMNAQDEIKQLVSEHSDVRVQFGVASLTSFPIKLRVPSIETWDKMADQLRRVGLKPDLTSVQSVEHGYRLHVEVHVPETWEEPAFRQTTRRQAAKREAD
ncbi:MAG: hypothetical protein KF726_03815 [Anaerolineae bacterium]|nr:hypothetical protein [Anaerolineae bacterium]